MVITAMNASAQLPTATPQPLPPPKPVIFVTDIGDDVSDAWALGLILCSPEIELKLLVTQHGDTTAKAQVAARFLESVERDEIPIAIGSKTAGPAGHATPWAQDYDLTKYPGGIQTDSTQAILDTLASTPETDTLIVTAPWHDLPALLRKAPGVASQARVIAMAGSIDRGYEGVYTPDAEFNVRTDIAAARTLFSAPWDLTLAPLDVSAVVQMRGTNYMEMLRLKNPVIASMEGIYQTWVDQTGLRNDTQVASSVLYDTVAVYLAIDRSLCVMEDIRLRVDDRGYTVRDGTGKKVDAALRWKTTELGRPEAFHDWMFHRYLKGVPSLKTPTPEPYDPFK